MDIEALKRRIPLGYPYLMIDRVTAQGQGEVTARKCVTVNEPFFQGHFRPPYPSVMPGTMLVEGMAQTAGLLMEEGLFVWLAGVERARFHRRVVPGDVVTYRAVLQKRRGPLLRAEVRAEVDGARVAEALILLMEHGERGEEDVGKTG
ncbi:MAG: 3-hydroxyacyl-ACP dehydratase FabZ [Candidatus Bipolaricaulota bacterium]